MARKKIPTPVKKKRKPRPPTWVACGFDLSGSSVTGAALAYDRTLNKMAGPVTTERRYGKDHYFQKLQTLVEMPTLVHELTAKLIILPDMDEIFIAVEEPFPMGLAKAGKLSSNWLKQQAQLTGAFLGGAAKWGYSNVYEVNNISWKRLVAEDMETTTADKNLKFLIKDWAMETYTGVPDIPDLIRGPGGLVPKPATSKAKSIQPDDIYDAIGIMNWMVNEIDKERG